MIIWYIAMQITNIRLSNQENWQMYSQIKYLQVRIYVYIMYSLWLY